jgi:UDP-N-acetylmuramoyl-L-alanyl-D-glutamate--2,6-diaminopimelate ligase
MTLREIIGPSVPPAAAAVEITALAYDDRAAAPGTLFFCVPGFTRDGHDFAPAAVERGASALVVERPLGLGVPEIVVPSVREAMAAAAVRFHGDPSGELQVAGVTGTNGKTTTAFLIRDLLEADGVQCGLLGTVKAVVGGVEREVVRTTAEAIELQRDLRAMVDGGDRACAIEVSSHALELHRADGIRFAVALFTNLTQDHLDFHPSMEEYFLAKRRLFELAEGARIVNVDDPYGRRLADELPGVVTFAIDRDADYRATDLEISRTGSRFRVSTPEGELEASTPLPGRFNVANALGALAGAGRVPGRFEPVDEGQPFAVLVDYAHTPDSLDNVLRAARALTSGRVISVFGCGGDRDRGKRPQMGEISSRLADVTIVTSDNPRSEEPEAIIREILAGAGPDVEWHVDRREAITRAVAEAEPGDVVVIAGKGHEQGQELAGGRKVPFDDVRVAREALRALPARAGGGAPAGR